MSYTIYLVIYLKFKKVYHIKMFFSVANTV